MKEKFVALIKAVKFPSFPGGSLDCTVGYQLPEHAFEAIADNLLANGAIVPPTKTVYRIVDKGTSFAMVMPQSVDTLTLLELKNLSKHGYYTSKEAAQRALEGKE